MTSISSTGDRRLARFGPAWPALLLLAVVALALLFPSGVFTIDEAIYLEMARAMAETGSLSLASNGGVDDAPALLRRFTHDVGGQAMPQYPSGYALIAAPFYAAFGLNGLILLNALSAFVAVLLTRRLAGLLYGDENVAWLAAGLLAGATFVSTYAFAVWPHMLHLALLLSGIERVVSGLRSNRSVMVAAGGVLLGLAVTVRVDAILAIFAVLTWLRLFGAPSRRGVAVVFLAGLVPGLLLASALNHLKFGVFLPVAYAPAGETTLVARYLPHMAVASIALAVLMLVDVSRDWAGKLARRVTAYPTSLILGGLALLLVIAVAPLRSWVFNTGVLVFDLQLVDPDLHRDGMSYDALGLKTFGGLNKAALVQSVPFVVLSIIALAEVWKGRCLKAHTLCFAMVAAFTLFYGLNQWHGGLSYSMRYFIPCLPMLAILSAVGLRRLAGNGRVISEPVTKALLVGVGLGLAMVALSPRLPDYAALMAYYLPLAVAMVLAGLVCAWLWRPGRSGAPAMAAGGIAIGLSAILSLQDFGQLTRTVASQDAFAARYDASIPSGALVVTYSERWMFDASAGGAHIVNPRGKVELDAVSSAFVSAGRCVIAHGDVARAELDPGSSLSWRAIEQGPEDEILGPLYFLQTDPRSCDR